MVIGCLGQLLAARVCPTSDLACGYSILNQIICSYFSCLLGFNLRWRHVNGNRLGFATERWRCIARGAEYARDDLIGDASTD
jgi:hypothetical protein